MCNLVFGAKVVCLMRAQKPFAEIENSENILIFEWIQLIKLNKRSILMKYNRGSL